MYYIICVAIEGVTVTTIKKYKYRLLVATQEMNRITEQLLG